MLQISSVNATELVIYLNGEEIYSDNATSERSVSVDLPKTLVGGERFELRILCRAVDGVPSGIRGNVRISFA